MNWLKKHKKPLRILVAAILCGLFVFSCLLGLVLRGEKTQIEGQPDVLIILGCRVMNWGPSMLLQDRLDAALTYLTDHPETIAILSGGQGPNEPTSEAQAMASFLQDNGIEPNRLFLEDKSSTTWENFTFSYALIQAHEIPTENGILIVSNGFHLTRARMLALRAGFDRVSTLCANTSHLSSRFTMHIREPLALLKSFLFDQ